jgi:hypothetical protein
MTIRWLRRRSFLKKATVLAGVISGSVVLGGSDVSAQPSVRALQVASTRDLGVVSKPASVLVRDGGATTLLGGKLLWIFGDTLFPNESVELRSNTAALANPAQPLATSEPLDPVKGRPYQFIPFTAEEQAYNDSKAAPDDRIAIWPTSAINYQGQGLMFSYKLHVKPGFLNYEPLGIALALVQPGQTQATRLPGLLFSSSEPDFVCGSIYQGMVYLYGANHQPGNPNVVARAPLSQATNRQAYTFWNGTAWTSDVSQAQPVISNIPGAITVSYNCYLGQFLATWSQTLGTDVLMSTAPSIVGPWSEPMVAVTGLPPASGSVNYAGIEHPELAKNGGRTVYVSYFNSTGFLAGDLRLVEVNFA